MILQTDAEDTMDRICEQRRHVKQNKNKESNTYRDG